MVHEFLDLQQLMGQRAIHVGRLVQKYKHYAFQQHSIVVATPYVVQLAKDFVDIAIGINNRTAISGTISVRVPVQLFDESTDQQVQQWILRQNAAYAVEIEKSGDLEKQQRDEELKILRFLIDKYLIGESSHAIPQHAIPQNEAIQTNE